jgi:hypothetical protein
MLRQAAAAAAKHGQTDGVWAARMAVILCPNYLALSFNTSLNTFRTIFTTLVSLQQIFTPDTNPPLKFHRR